jgi:hypothetical protein
MIDTCDLESCGKETGLKEGVVILHIARKEEMPTDKSGITELGKTSYIDSASEVYSFCDLDCLFMWILKHKEVKDEN